MLHWGNLFVFNDFLERPYDSFGLDLVIAMVLVVVTLTVTVIQFFYCFADFYGVLLDIDIDEVVSIMERGVAVGLVSLGVKIIQPRQGSVDWARGEECRPHHLNDLYDSGLQ